eukprot:jgi/Psemu1/54398/gm1.54398_g
MPLPTGDDKVNNNNDKEEDIEEDPLLPGHTDLNEFGDGGDSDEEGPLAEAFAAATFANNKNTIDNCIKDNINDGITTDLMELKSTTLGAGISTATDQSFKKGLLMNTSITSCLLDVPLFLEEALQDTVKAGTFIILIENQKSIPWVTLARMGLDSTLLFLLIQMQLVFFTSKICGAMG